MRLTARVCDPDRNRLIWCKPVMLKEINILYFKDRTLIIYSNTNEKVLIIIIIILSFNSVWLNVV